MDTPELVEATLGVLERMIEGLGNELVKVTAENVKLKKAIVRGRELYRENEPQQMFLVWKQALKEK